MIAVRSNIAPRRSYCGSRCQTYLQWQFLFRLSASVSPWVLSGADTGLPAHLPLLYMLLPRLRTVERKPATRPREKRERERDVAILAQVLHLCLEACSASLHRGRCTGLPWGCALRGAPLPFPAVLELNIPVAALLEETP